MQTGLSTIQTDSVMEQGGTTDKMEIDPSPPYKK